MVGGGGRTKLQEQVYGCVIDAGNPDPSARVSYPERIFGQPNGAFQVSKPASGTGVDCMGDWAGCNLITGIKRQTTADNGATWVDVADKRAAVGGAAETDYMTYVPTWWFKMETVDNAITLAFSSTQIDDTWKDYAGSLGSVRYGHFRVGCYAAYNVSSRLYSRGNVKPTAYDTITEYIKYAKARGTGYDIITWYQWTYLAALATLLYKSTNLQAALACGYVNGKEVQKETPITYANDYGMAGSSSDTEQMAFFWIQNMWGNVRTWCGGVGTDSSKQLQTQTGYSSTTAFNKTALGTLISKQAYITQVIGTTDAGFAPKAGVAADANAFLYFCDYASAATSKLCSVGGDYSSKNMAGPYAAAFAHNATQSFPMYGTRLSYRL